MWNYRLLILTLHMSPASSPIPLSITIQLYWLLPVTRLNSLGLRAFVKAASLELVSRSLGWTYIPIRPQPFSNDTQISAISPLGICFGSHLHPIIITGLSSILDHVHFCHSPDLMANFDQDSSNTLRIDCIWTRLNKSSRILISIVVSFKSYWFQRTSWCHISPMITSLLHEPFGAKVTNETTSEKSTVNRLYLVRHTLSKSNNYHSPYRVWEWTAPYAYQVTDVSYKHRNYPRIPFFELSLHFFQFLPSIQNSWIRVCTNFVPNTLFPKCVSKNIWFINFLGVRWSHNFGQCCLLN